jgi:hypothetical protein
MLNLGRPSQFRLFVQDLLSRYVCTCSIKKPCNLLQSRASGLDEQEPNAQTLDYEDDNIHEIEFPSKVLKADGVHYIASEYSVSVGNLETHHID